MFLSSKLNDAVVNKTLNLWTARWVGFAEIFFGDKAVTCRLVTDADYATTGKKNNEIRFGVANTRKKTKRFLNIMGWRIMTFILKSRSSENFHE